MSGPEQTITLRNGRRVSLADYGKRGDVPVIWCHGAPNTRMEPRGGVPEAQAAGFRLIGIDRPGYGESTPVPGRSIADWVPEALEIADYLGVDRFYTVGCSTGGAYSLALAAAASDRVLGVIACCALTDTRWPEGRALMTAGDPNHVWNAPNREAAMAIVKQAWGADGLGIMQPPKEGVGRPMAKRDLEILTDPARLMQMRDGVFWAFHQGVIGYTDDRLADGPGWESFDVNKVRCPVTVLHGGSDSIVPVALAHHTAQIVPGAVLKVYEHEGHFSIAGKIIETLKEMRRAA